MILPPGLTRRCSGSRSLVRSLAASLGYGGPAQPSAFRTSRPPLPLHRSVPRTPSASEHRPPLSLFATRTVPTYAQTWGADRPRPASAFHSLGTPEHAQSGDLGAPFTLVAVRSLLLHAQGHRLTQRSSGLAALATELDFVRPLGGAFPPPRPETSRQGPVHQCTLIILTLFVLSPHQEVALMSNVPNLGPPATLPLRVTAIAMNTPKEGEPDAH